jgi:hypothetical protein
MPSDPIDPDAPRTVTSAETALSRRVDLTTEGEAHAVPA